VSPVLTIPGFEEIKAQFWEPVANEAEFPTYSKIADRLFQKAAALQQAGDEIGFNVYRFLGQLSHLHLQPENKDVPLRAAWISSTGRSTALEDFDNDALNAIHQLVAITAIPILRARFADIIWIVRKDHKMAHQAASDYLLAFKAVDDGDKWAWEFECLKRGMGIACALGREKQLFKDYVNFIETRLGQLETECSDALAAGMLDLLAEHRAGDVAHWARIAETIGDRLDSTVSSFLARDYLDRAIQFHRINNDAADAQRVGVKKAESLVRQADVSISNKNQGYLVGAHHLALAIECLRQSSGDEARIQSLHEKLLEWQEKSAAEMKSFSQEIDVSKLVKAAQERMKGKALREAIFAMALGHPVINTEELRKRVLGHMKDFPMTHLMGVSLVGRDGRLLGHKPPALASTSEEVREAAIEIEMFHQAAQIDWNLRAQAYIEICRREILSEHGPALRDLQFLVLHNPFIPPGHEMLFLKGITAGFRGELDIAAHFLVPQIEECIRHVLSSAGHITSKLDATLIQEQRLLGTLLSLPETIELFGKDHVFELRGILCEKFGYDLRNRLAHGFLTYGECWSGEVLNIWWLVIRFLCVPLAQRGAPKDDSSTKPES
jgi:hypothetical protein